MNTNTNPKVSNTEQAAHKKVDSAADGAHKAVDWAADTASNAKHSLDDAGQDLKETQERWLAIARDYVQENPVTAVGIAVASGFLISRLLPTR